MNRHGSMNRVYRLVWSLAQGAWIPVAETTRGRAVSGRTRRPAASRNALLALLSLAAIPAAQGAPAGGKVVSGAGAITQSGNTTDVTQTSQNLSINWQTFNVSTAETVDFLQPSASAVAINRILGGSGSQILGHLQSNGQVYLINPDGIVFGKGSVVNVGGLVASTLDLNDPAFVGSEKSFSGSAAGAVLNQGTITAATGGYVALLGNRVGNQGVITARLGTVALGGGTAVTLTFAENSLVHLQVDRSALGAAVSNGGLIQADGGRVAMTAGAKDALLASVVNNTGVIEARTVENHNGVISLLGGMNAGTIEVGGTLDASAPAGGSGGQIETSAARVTVAPSTKVTTAAAAGLYGSWLIDPQDFTVAASGGDITGATLSSELNSTPVTLQSSSGHATGSGNVNVNDAVSWSANTALTLTASNSVNVNSIISATGASAGVAINPNTANGGEAASGSGTFNLGAGAAINLPNVSPTSATALVIAGTPYSVINSLGAAGSTSGTDLQGISGNLTGHYALGSNIDASATSSWNSGAGFTPIGTFTGSFDGLGHTIANLTVNLPTTTDVGLFGSMGPGAVIRNVGLAGGSVTGGSYVGALVGFDYSSSISNSYSSAHVTGSEYVGGLVGYQLFGSIDASHASSDVSGTTYVGGLVGYTHGTVTNSHASGAVNGSSYVGGLVGFVYGNYQLTGTVSNSYATGNVSGSNSVGGLAGGVGGSYGGSANGYATGAVTGGDSVGGLVGSVGGGGDSDFGFAGLANGSATGKVSGNTNVGGLVGLNGGAVSGTATGNVSGTTAVGGFIGSNGGDWSGNFETGGKVGTASGTASGNVTGTTNVGGFAGVNGGASGAYGVVGTIIGGHATGSVTGTGNKVGGLVGYNYGTISGSTASGSVKGLNYVGGLLGSSIAPNNPNDDTIISVTNSSATGSVHGASYVGGLAGSMASSPIRSSYATGTVSGSGNYVGGLVGYLGYGACCNDTTNPIENSYATGNVSGASDVGGLIGHVAFFGYGLTVLNSYSTGNVSGTSNVGGLVGYGADNGSADPSITNTYSAGRVSGSTHVGGLVGYNNGFVSTSFWDTTTSGQSSSAGGIGLTTAQMQTEANFVSATPANGNVNPGWDFAHTWVMYDGHTYPLLSSFMTPLTVTPNSGTVTYNGSAYDGSLGVTYSTAPNANLLGTLVFNAPQGAVNVGTYTLTPSGLYSNQQGYIISYGTGTLTINQLASVAWVGGSSGLWSNAGNWAGGALPDYSNVAAVTIPKGVTVTYDASVPGATKLTSLTSKGNLDVAAGSLSTTGNLSTAGYDQTGGSVAVGGALSIASTAGAVSLGKISAGSLDVTSTAGAITQVPSTALDVSGTSVLSADNGVAGSGDVKYGVTLSDVGNNFVGAVTATGSNVSLTDASGGLILGNITASGTLSVTTRGAAMTQEAGTAIDVSGTSKLVGDNGSSGSGDQRHSITLANTGNHFVGAVTATGSNVSLTDASGGLILGNVTTSGTFTAVTRDGAMTQQAGTAIDVAGTSKLVGDNGSSGAGDQRHSITLSNTGNHFVGAVTATGSNVSLTDASGGLILGNVTTSGTFTAVTRDGAMTQQAGTAIDVAGTSKLVGDNGGSGAGDQRHSITLANTGNHFVGAVTATGSAISLANAQALTANVTSTGAVSLTAAGKLAVSGTVGTDLKTATTGGSGSTTTFGATTVGDDLDVTSTGAVTTATPTTPLKVHGAGTTTPNSHVKVNGVTGAIIK